MPVEIDTDNELRVTPVEAVEPPVVSRNGISRLLSFLLIACVRAYQWTLSPFLGGQCRFEPSCSRYFIAAVEKYGPLRGALKGLCRIGRCHPFRPGGYDPP